MLTKLSLNEVRDLEAKLRVPLITCEAEILIQLLERDHSAGELAKKSRRSSASFFQTLSRLLDSALVTSREDGTDRRKVIYSLSGEIVDMKQNTTA